MTHLIGSQEFGRAKEGQTCALQGQQQHEKSRRSLRSAAT